MIGTARICYNLWGRSDEKPEECAGEDGSRGKSDKWRGKRKSGKDSGSGKSKGGMGDKGEKCSKDGKCSKEGKSHAGPVPSTADSS